MADEMAPLKAYAVALSFGNGGPLHVNTTLAPAPEAAAAVVAVTLMQAAANAGSPIKESLIGVHMIELSERWLQAALEGIRGQTAPSGAKILSLVREPVAPTVDEPPAAG